MAVSEWLHDLHLVPHRSRGQQRDREREALSLLVLLVERTRLYGAFRGQLPRRVLLEAEGEDFSTLHPV